MPIALSRRQAVAAGLAAGALCTVPGLSFAAAATDRRFVFVIQRGACDGLSLLPPVGDPAFATLRGSLLEPGAHDLDGFFALHPAMPRTAALFAAGEARGVHAVATGYRDRSHFDGQNVLESGGAQPYALKTGWIGRLLPLLPTGADSALALAATVPLALRGPATVATYAPGALPSASDDLLGRVSELYGEDATLAPLWAEAMRTRTLTGDIGGNAGKNGGDLGTLAASLLKPAGGARVMMIETGGWDTHSGQRARLTTQLSGLDAMLGALRDGLGADWAQTLVLVATEFGRTARINGTDGTDHGTGSAALLLGGGLPRGRPVTARWPGLGPGALFEDRDLAPTARLGDVASDALSRHYGIARAHVARLFA